MSTLRIRGVTHRYVLAEVLSDINLQLGAGQTVALVGPSGCGKSTLLHCVAGLLTPSQGVVESSFSQLGMVFQQPRLMPWKRAVDNIALGLKARGIPAAERRRQAIGLAQNLGLNTDDMIKYPHELSGGMQSRVSLGRALALAPDLLVLDEPFSALDVGLKVELYALMREQITKKGTAVLMITHDLMEAVRLADRVVMMMPDPGRIVREFTLDEPHDQRSDAWIYATTAQLMQADEVRMGFGLSAVSQTRAYSTRTKAVAHPAGPVHGGVST